MPFQQLLFGFSGRINRNGFWMGIAISSFLILTIIAILVVFEMHRSPPAFLDDPPMPDPRYQPPEFFVISTLVFFPLLAISVKRLHDRSKSFWWSVPMIVAPVLMLFFALPPWHRPENWSWEDPWAGLTWSPPGLWIGLIVVALGLLAWWVVELGMRPGTPGANRYGPAEYPAIGSAKKAAVK
jgi:uncharacterized membrane protein YhaH (DUF805 family)